MSSKSYSLAIDELRKQDEVAIEEVNFEPTLNLIINTQYQRGLNSSELAKDKVAKIEGRLTVSF